jgi:hypothetical protein
MIRQLAHRLWLGCQPYNPADLYTQKYLLVLISVGGHRGVVSLEGLGKLKQFIYLIGTRTRDIPLCIIAPQPSTLT